MNGMEILFSHKTALEYWRLHGCTNNTFTRRQRKRKAPIEAPETEALRKFDTGGLSYPLNIMVGTPNARRESQILHSRLFSGMMQEGSIVNVGEGLLVSSPELCFFQMASEMSLVKLVELGFELCGSYSKLVPDAMSADSSDIKRGFKKRPPLTSVKRLSAYLRRMEGILGQKKLSIAINYIADGAESPMETILTMLLTLPYKYGGYGLSMPMLNAPINTTKIGNQSSDSNLYRCDLYWPKNNVVAEYDSDMFHTGSENIARDSIRRNALTSSGRTVMTVTKRQLYSTEEFNKVAKQLAAKTGKRLRLQRNQEFAGARQKLRALLLSMEHCF